MRYDSTSEEAPHPCTRCLRGAWPATGSVHHYAPCRQTKPALAYRDRDCGGVQQYILHIRRIRLDAWHLCSMAHAHSDVQLSAVACVRGCGGARLWRLDSRVDSLASIASPAVHVVPLAITDRTHLRGGVRIGDAASSPWSRFWLAPGVSASAGCVSALCPLIAVSAESRAAVPPRATCGVRRPSGRVSSSAVYCKYSCISDS